ncbi:lipid A 4'-phosphatase [Alphaproteobacteria bacterium]
MGNIIIEQTYKRNYAGGVVVFLSFFSIIAAFFLKYPGVDLYVSHLFYDKSTRSFFSGDIVVSFANHFLNLLAVLLALCIVVFVVKTYAKRKSNPHHYKNALYIALVAVVGYLFLVAFVSKHTFKRPRPEDIVEFGGTVNFIPAFVIGNQCKQDCSFVSGHSTIGFMLYSIAFLFKKGEKKRTMWFIAATISGLICGFIRIMAGKHFLSDVIFSGLIMYGTAASLAHVMKLSEK